MDCSTPLIFWLDTFQRFLKDDLGLSPLRGDPSVYLCVYEGHANDMFGNCIDDCLGADDQVFIEVIDEISHWFDTKERDYDIFTFFGMLTSKMLTISLEI